MNRNSSRSTGNEYPVPCSALSEVWSGLCSTPNLPALCRHLLHHLSVILLQAVLLNDFLQVLGILAACGVTGFLNALCPALVIVRGEFEATGIAAVLLQKAGMMLV